MSKVNLYSLSRVRDGKLVEQHTVSWWVNGKRKRKQFSSLQKAEAHKEHVERLLYEGAALAASAPPDALALFELFLRELPLGLTPHAALEFAIKNHPAVAVAERGTLVKETIRRFLESRRDCSERHIRTVHQHLSRFAKHVTGPITRVTTETIDNYIARHVPGSARTKQNHIVSLRALFNFAKQKGLLPKTETAADGAVLPGKTVRQTSRPIYAPEELKRWLCFADPRIVPALVVRAFTGCREAESTRLRWRDWRGDRFVFEPHITKTRRRRLPEVPPNLREWLSLFAGEPDDLLVQLAEPDEYSRRARVAAGVPRKDNGLRAAYCSFGIEMWHDIPRVAKNAGHSVQMLQEEYVSLDGVCKQTAEEWFSITPQVVLDYVADKGLPKPEWAARLSEKGDSRSGIPSESSV